MYDKEKRHIEQDIIGLDQGWAQYLDEITTKSFGLTLGQYKVFDRLTGEEARGRLLKYRTSCKDS